MAQEERLQFEHFDFDVAWALGCFMVELARSRSLGVAIAIRRNGQRLFHAALPGATADNDEWIERKSRVVDRFAHSSRYMGALMESPENNAAGVTFEQNFRLDPLRFAAHGGAFPVIVRGSGMIGTVTVSGLPQLEDHAFIVEALGRFLSDL
ncbi:MAG: heme-degrading domain-containing protein [Micrococcales bacterium]|nr:heme-degrading domain-containing protein [Micrococcales bacterium]